MKLLQRLRWALSKCGYCKRRIFLDGFILIASNPKKSWREHAIHARECRPNALFYVRRRCGR